MRTAGGSRAPTRVGVTSLVAVVLSCTGPALADERVCNEVARAAEALAEPSGEAGDGDHRYDHDVAVTASHLLIAADGDIDGVPAPELAEVVRTAGWAGVRGRLADYVGPLADGFTTCEDAGIDMPRAQLRSVQARADAEAAAASSARS